MARRYFMNLRYRDRLFRDEEGDELPELGAVREHTLATARDLIEHTRSGYIRDWFDCTFEVTDEAGHIVLTLPFREISRADYDSIGSPFIQT